MIYLQGFLILLHLLQTGYLTIDRVVQHMFGPAYYLHFPNKEIEDE